MQQDKNLPQAFIPLFKGTTQDITLPSTKVITIRETNGGDDDIISDVSNADDGTNTFAFLSAIIDKDHDLGRKPTTEEVRGYLTNDSYAALLKQRIFNHGPELLFKSICQKPSCLHEMEVQENLGDVDGDMKDPDFKPKNSFSLRRYPMGKTSEVELTLSSGKKLSYSILTGVLGKESLGDTKVTKNSSLKYRKLKVFNNGAWVEIKDFQMFSSKEMVEIRKSVAANDTLFQPIIKFTCPKCQTAHEVSLWNIGAFFYPGEEI